MTAPAYADSGDGLKTSMKISDLPELVAFTAMIVTPTRRLTAEVDEALTCSVSAMTPLPAVWAVPVFTFTSGQRPYCWSTPQLVVLMPLVATPTPKTFWTRFPAAEAMKSQSEMKVTASAAFGVAE